MYNIININHFLGGGIIYNLIDFTYITGLTIGIAQFLKKKYHVQMRYFSLINMAIAIALSLFLTNYEPIYERLIRGILMGLCATGTYDTCKGIKNKEKKDIHNLMNED